MVSEQQRRFTYLAIGMVRNSLEFYVKGFVLHTCLLDLHTIYKGCPHHNTDISGVVMHEVIIKEKGFRRPLREENNRIMAAWNFR